MLSPIKFSSKMFVMVASFGLMLPSASLYAKQHMAISLKGTSVIPSVITEAKGKGKIFVFPNRTVSGSIQPYGFVATEAYIHVAAAGKNGPQVITLIKTANGSFEVPDEARLTRAQYKSYMAGKLYVTVRSNRYPQGEIRAQIPLMRTSTSSRYRVKVQHYQ